MKICQNVGDTIYLNSAGIGKKYRKHFNDREFRKFKNSIKDNKKK